MVKKFCVITRALKAGGLIFCVLLSSGPGLASAEDTVHTLAASDRQFLFDGKPYQIISGEMHYPRIPRPDWRQRFRLAKAMGLNSITTYVFWNLHEPRPGVYDFSGQNDLAEYIREAQQEGLNVILRPGPYVCAEWELGGYPSWLLKDRTMTLRSDDPKYLAAMRSWFDRLGKEIRPLLLKNGGPIIAIQVENEYGSFGDSHEYMEAVKSALQASGMGDGLLYTADGPEQVKNGSLPELPAVINFGTGDAEKGFALLDTIRPDGPRMSGEYWAGWFDHWGDQHHKTDGRKEAAELAWMLGKGYSISMYMFNGGTSFGWMNGANSNGTNYEPDTTSYDYDAPVNESGEPGEKFMMFREAIAKATGKTLPPVPAAKPRQSFEFGAKTETASLWKNLPEPISSKSLKTMEDLDQSYGYILYRTGLKQGDGGELAIEGLHDYAQVYLNQELVGTLDRRLNQSKLTLPALKAAGTLDILVENSGRVNFTKVIRNERKGIVGSVAIGGKTPESWEIYSLPLDHLEALHFASEPCNGPCFTRMNMNVTSPADTYLEPSAVTKGEVWINRKMLGRVWAIGPQYTLYTPASWLKDGTNEVIVFDLQAKAKAAMKSVKNPVFGDTKATRD